MQPETVNWDTTEFNWYTKSKASLSLASTQRRHLGKFRGGNDKLFLTLFFLIWFMQHQRKPHPRSCRVCLGGWMAASRAQKSRSRIQKSIENVSPPLAGDPGQLGRTRWKQSHILVGYGGTAITREENFVFSEDPSAEPVPIQRRRRRLCDSVLQEKCS